MFGMRWQQYELWSGIVNLSSLAVIKDEKNSDGGSDRPPPMLVKCQSADIVRIHFSVAINFKDCILCCGKLLLYYFLHHRR